MTGDRAADLKHVIVPVEDRFELRTHYGYVLKSFDTEQEAKVYYASHCGSDLVARGRGRR